MRKFGFLAFAAALFAALGSSAIERHDDSYVRNGVTYAQRGGMSAETYVVTNVDMTADDVGAVWRDETWESVSNKAITAIQTLEPATNYTDEAIAALKKVDGAARALPPYLHYMTFDDVYTNDAALYYEQASTNYVHGSCSARRVGGILERNYDWEFDRAPEFVIPVSGSDTRFASVGIANVGRLLTEDFVTSGKWSRYYRCLPGHTLDGVNENGVVAEINVVGGVPFGWRSTGDIHPLGAVRWALDNGTSAEMVATSLAVRVKFPAGWSQNFHYMIADAKETWIVENGEAHMVGTVANVSVMTNFRLFPTPDDYGDGQERYAILADTARPITDAWFTRCYKRETTPPWVSDLREVLAYTNAIYDAWATHDREFFRDMSFDGKRWWQTVHTSVYDFEAKTLKVCVQESGDWYVFAVGGSGRVKSVNGKVGHVTLGPDEVNALPDDAERLVENSNFSNAVVSVSPPVVLPEKWAFSNITNANGDAVNSDDVGALSKDGGIITGSLIIGGASIEDDESLSADNCIRANGGFSRFSDSWYPKLKWMGEYFEDSMSGENGRIYIPYTDAPWIDAIKEGSVKGLALYSDLDGFLKSESDPLSYHTKPNISVGQITNDFGETVPSAVKVGNVEQWETYGSQELSIDPKRGFTAKVEDDGTIAVFDSSGIKWWGGGYPSGVYREFNFFNLPNFLITMLSETATNGDACRAVVCTNICKIISPELKAEPHLALIDGEWHIITETEVE